MNRVNQFGIDRIENEIGNNEIYRMTEIRLFRINHILRVRTIIVLTLPIVDLL